MSLTWEIDSTDVTSLVRYKQWALTESAERGVVGASTFVLDDTTGSYIPPGQKAVIIEEASASPVRMFTGYVAERSAKRGPLRPGERQWTVTVEDLNVLLDDRIITDAMNGNRDPETDYQRIQWLIGTAAMGPISAGRIPGPAGSPSAPAFDMDKVDYRGKTPRDVLEDCAQKSGKTFFVYRYGSGPLLYYDLPNGDGLSSTAKISDVASEVNGTTVFAPVDPTYSVDPSRVYSKVRVRYKGGSTTVEDAGTAAAFRTREVYKRYMRVKSAARAAEQAQKWLEQADDETRVITCSVRLGAAYVNDIRAGQRIEIKLTRFGIASYVWWRITKRTVRQLSDDVYEVELTFAEKIRSTLFQGGPDISVDEEQSNGTEDTATAVLDAAGLTITGGKISVANAGGTVIIDGSSDFFTIVAQGNLTIPDTQTQRGTAYRSAIVTTGLEYDPACLFFVVVPSPDGKGTWGQPTPELHLSASGTVLRMVGGRARYESGSGASAKTQVQIYRFSSTASSRQVTVRYFILKKQAI